MPAGQIMVQANSCPQGQFIKGTPTDVCDRAVYSNQQKKDRECFLHSLSSFFDKHCICRHKCKCSKVFAYAKVKLLCSEVRAIARVKLSLPTLPKAKLHYPQDNFTQPITTQIEPAQSGANPRYFLKTHSQSPHLASFFFKKYHQIFTALGKNYFKRTDFLQKKSKR